MLLGRLQRVNDQSRSRGGVLCLLPSFKPSPPKRSQAHNTLYAHKRDPLQAVDKLKDAGNPKEIQALGKQRLVYFRAPENMLQTPLLDSVNATCAVAWGTRSFGLLGKDDGNQRRPPANLEPLRRICFSEPVPESHQRWLGSWPRRVRRCHGPCHPARQGRSKVVFLVLMSGETCPTAKSCATVVSRAKSHLRTWYISICFLCGER